MGSFEVWLQVQSPPSTIKTIIISYSYSRATLGTPDATIEIRKHKKNSEAEKMKRILSTIVASLVAIAFAGIAFAAEPAMTPGQPEATAKTAPAKAETSKTMAPKTVKKHHKKHTKKHKVCKPAAKKSEAPASAAESK
jgi:hypothetical protein